MFEKLAGKRGLSLDRLITLCRVARAGSIGEASESDPNRQAQFSRQVSELEEFIGVPLLDRQQKPFRLNADGEALTRLCSHFFAGLDDFLSERKDQETKLVVGAGESLIQWYLMPKWMDLWSEALPGVSVIFKNLQTQEIVDQLRNGDIDLALTRENAVKPPLCKAGAVRFGYRCFMPRSFRGRPTGDVIDFGEMSRYPIAVLEGGGQFRRGLEAAMEKGGVAPRFQMECSSSTQVAKAVEHRQYCAVLPDYARGQLPAHVVDYAVRGFKMQRSLCIAWHPKRAEFRPLLTRAIHLLRTS